MFFEVLSKLNISDKEAAEDMNWQASRLSESRKGSARVPLDGLLELSNDVWVEFRNRVDAAKGLNPEREDDLYAEQIGSLLTMLLKHRAARRTA